MRIAIVIPYFGKWPPYFNVYLKGCEGNPWLDVLFFTDCPIPAKYPANVHFFTSSLKETSDLISQKTGARVNIKFAYKLCDLKPFYGKVYEDFLRDYDYWGYSDIDLFYGNLEPFILPRINDGFDILSSREATVCGSFTVLRNCPTVCNLYQQIPDFPTLLQTDKCEALDETCWSDLSWKGESKLKLPKASFTYIAAKANENGSVKVSFTNICREHVGRDEKLVYESPRVKCKDEEYGYFHYIHNKSRVEFKFPKWDSVPDKFYVTATGFYTLNQFKFYSIAHNYRQLRGLIRRARNKFLKPNAN
jgi:hypothetical protein